MLGVPLPRLGETNPKTFGGITMASLKDVLEAGSVLVVPNTELRRFAIEGETFEGTKAEENALFPERYPDFEIDFSGWTVQQLCEAAFGRTALVDTARQEFRKKDADTAAAFRGSFEQNGDRPIFRMTADDLAKLKLPKSEAEKLAEAKAVLAKLQATGMSQEDLLKLLGLG